MGGGGWRFALLIRFCVSLCFGIHYLMSSIEIILPRKGELVTLLLLSFGCLVTVNVLKLFLTVPLVGLQFVIVVFPDHTHLLFYHMFLKYPMKMK